MDIYFLRHGMAGQRSKWEGADRERPLTGEGKERMAREAATIARLGFALDLIITSPLVRAYQTAEIAAQQLNMLDRLIQDERLAPGFGPDQLAQILKAHPGAASFMLVGHEPDFSETIQRLIGGGQVVCKKGSLAYVNLYNPAALRGELVWLIPPQVLAL
jgi:phosphohistidine phosphatase